MPDLAACVAAAERAVFHGPPGSALPVLAEAAELATGENGSAAVAVLTWLRGVALGACGRYAEALSTLDALLAGPAATARGRLALALAAAASGSVHRQLGLHAEARTLDERGRAAVESLGPPATEALLDCLVGLAADAVGLDDATGAAAEIVRAEAVVAEREAATGWRPRCRLDWVRAETALLTGDAAVAVAAASRALATAQDAEAPRHVAKSLLFLGVAQSTLGSAGSAAQAAATLRRAATLAESLGTLPLVWPARAVLGALVAGQDPGESAASLDAARAAVRALADNLPAALRDPWLARPDLSALLAG